MSMYSSPRTGLEGPWGFQEVHAPRFPDNLHIKVVRLSAQRTGRLYFLPQEIILAFVFFLEVEPDPGPQCGRKDFVNEKFQ